MHLNHFYLYVASVERAAKFYARYFDLRPHVTHDDILFLRDRAGMDLALAAGPPGDVVPWSHFGFRLDDSAAVSALHDRLAADGAAIRTPLTDDGEVVWFRCADPDGHRIEVYWQAQPAGDAVTVSASQ